MTTRLITGDCREMLRTLPDASVQCCVTSPPYFGLRDYGNAAQLGMEPTPDAYVAEMVAVFREVRRVLRDDGTLWLNIGDTYASTPSGALIEADAAKKSTLRGTFSNQFAGRMASKSRTIPAGTKSKDLIGIPWRLAFALRADGWYLRQEIIWHKPNPMPESVTDRCTKAHESLFLLSKRPRYYFDAKAIAEVGSMRPPGNAPGGKHIAVALTDPKARTKANLHKIGPAETRNRRSVWTIASEPSGIAHFAMMPSQMARDCIMAGSRPGDTVLDPFAGAGTTGLAADRLQRDVILIELNPAYAAMAHNRINDDGGMFAGATE